MAKIYLASPFFNDDEKLSVRLIAGILRNKGHEVFVPMEHEIEGGFSMTNFEWANNVFRMDKNALSMCDVVVAINYGLYSDSGTAWECGYAFALNIPVIVYTPDLEEVAQSSLMVVNGCHANIIGIVNLDCYDFDTLPVYNYSGEQK